MGIYNVSWAIWCFFMLKLGTCTQKNLARIAVHLFKGVCAPICGWFNVLICTQCHIPMFKINKNFLQGDRPKFKIYLFHFVSLAHGKKSGSIAIVLNTTSGNTQRAQIFLLLPLVTRPAPVRVEPVGVVPWMIEVLGGKQFPCYAWDWERLMAIYTLSLNAQAAYTVSNPCIISKCRSNFGADKIL